MWKKLVAAYIGGVIGDYLTQRGNGSTPTITGCLNPTGWLADAQLPNGYLYIGGGIAAGYFLGSKIESAVKKVV